MAALGLAIAWVDSELSFSINRMEFVVTNVNSSDILTESDIPGALLPQETPELCNVVQLKRWLTCRGASTTGRKVELASRVKDHMKCGLDKKELRDPDGGVHLARKKAQLGILEQHIPDCTAPF
ncbi:uncharacterized protein LOC122949962 [Acropora millepora]|uniref:uncharacterized protein LOC122949962 n=1 Tax=Acropora millepora TaxID=45264 RepID=UPI001CF43D49|nr:uncharacterized protein LOC122949962 [Acropora millepora]